MTATEQADRTQPNYYIRRYVMSMRVGSTVESTTGGVRSIVQLLPISTVWGRLAALRTRPIRSFRNSSTRKKLCEQMPEPELFEYDTEKWFRKYMALWSEARIRDELRRIRMLSLLEFYEGATKLYPDLRERLPKLLPSSPPRCRTADPAAADENNRLVS